MKRIIIGLLAAGVVFSAVYAAAASLGGITSDQVGADSALVTSCDDDGVTVTYTVAYDATVDFPVGGDVEGGYKIATVVVSGINEACEDGTLSVTLTNSTASVGDGSVTITGTTATLTAGVDLDDDIPAEAVNDIHAAILSATIP